MRKYQVVTLPPNARLKLMQMKLPEAEPGVLEDTVPPNRGVTAPTAHDANDETMTVAPVADRSRFDETVVVPRVQRKRQLKAIVIAAVGGGIALLLLGLMLRREGPAPIETNVHDQAPAATAVLEPQARAPQVVAPTGTLAVAPTPAAEPVNSATARGAPDQEAATASKKGARDAKPSVPPISKPEAPKQAAPKPAAVTATPPTPPASPRGKQPWIDGL